MIKALIDGLSQLPDAEELRGGLIKLVNAKIKPRGSSMVEVIDSVMMNVHVVGSGCVELRVRHKRIEDVIAIREAKECWL